MTQALPPLILITGATGYVGGRLLKALEHTTHRLRCLARRPEFLRPRVAPGTEVVCGDVRDGASLREAMRGVHTAYYLVHAMGSTAAFEAADRQAAQCFATAARQAAVQRVIYLGGWAKVVVGCRHTCGVARKSEQSSRNPGCQCSSFARRLSLALAASPSKSSGPWWNGCR